MKTMESRTLTYYTTARWIQSPETEDWLWINTSQSHHFADLAEAEKLAELANHNGVETGLDVINYPYFAIQVNQTSVIKEV